MKIKKKPTKLYGNRIKQILQKIDMSPQELADIIKVNKSHMSRIINGQRRCLSLPTAMAIALALKTPVEEVFIYQKPYVKSKEKLDEE